MSPERWREIEDVFQAAVDLPRDDRAAFLDERCGNDRELKNEVEKLLRSDDSAAEFIESPIWTDSNFLNTSAKKELSRSIDSENGDRDGFIGKQVGVYRLTREIGRGGMGAVYLAERADGEFHQRVAIKLIKRGMDSDFIIRRFRHERQILASFEHPFIARLLDGGTTGDGTPYFVMEFVEGETFYNYADGKRLGTKDRLKLFQKVCSAIDYAHEKKIIHRDIKPSNILINKLGSPKLLDFGIAKILDPNLIHESINPTASMLRMMTPDYASPEQVEGADVTAQSDIYSLGILLYELLTGHKPYNFAGRALHEVSRVICEVMPEPPSKIVSQSENLLPKYSGAVAGYLDARSTSEQQLVQDLAGDLDNIVMKAIAKDPADRYATVSEFSRDISRYLSGTRVEAPSFVRTSRPSTDAFLRVPQNSKALAVLPFKFLNLGPSGDTDDRFLGLGLADALITRLSKVRRFVVRPTSSILSFGEDVIDPIRAGRDLNVDYILDGSIKKAGDRLRVSVQLLSVSDNAAVWATAIDETLSDVLTLEDTLANKVIEVLLPQLTGGELEEFVKRGTDDPEAFEHYLRGRYYFNSFTEDGFAKAFVSFHSAIAADPNYAHAYAGLADYYNWLGIVGVLPPQECFQPATEAASKAIELDDNLSEGHASLGFSLHAGSYDWAKAEHHLRRAIELSQSNANAYVWYSIVLFTEGRFDEGLGFARRGVEIDPLSPFNHHNVGWGLYFARRFDEAAAQYRRVVSEFPTYGFGYYGLSKIHRITGETKLAIAENDKAKEMMGDSIFSLLSEAECYAADGQAEIAREKIGALEALARDRYVSPYQLALAYTYLGDRESALESLSKAAEIKEAWLNWLGVEPAFDPIRDDPRFDEVLERTGYRMLFKNFSASGTDLDARASADGKQKSALHDLTTLVIDEPDTTDDGIPKTARRRSNKLGWIAGAAAAVLALAGGWYYFHTTQMNTLQQVVIAPASFQNPSIVIVPFGVDGGADQALGVGFADALTTKLGSIKALRVLSASTGRAIDIARPAEVANELGIAFILKGRLAKDAEATLLTAELVNAPTGHVMWSETLRSTDGDWATLHAKLAEKLWTSLRIDPLPLERQQVSKSYTRNSQAYERYLVGRSLMANRSVGNLRKAIEVFASSLEADPEFVLAYIGLADAYALLNLYDLDPPPDAYAKAKHYIQRALSIDDSLAEAHATLAYIKFYGERNRETAELEFRRAIQLNPSYAQAHHWFALALAGMGDGIESISEAQIAEQLDPRSPAVKSAHAMTYAFHGQYPEAIAECDEALQIDERFMPAIRVKRWASVAMKDWDGAKAAFAKELEYGGGSLDEPGWRIIEIQVTAPGEDRAEKLRQLEETIRSEMIQKNHRAFSFEVAIAYNALGETEKALDWLERSEAAQSHSFNYLEVDPRIINLRNEPRFRKLVEKLKIPREF